MVWSCTEDGGKLIAEENSYLDLMGEKKKPEGPRTHEHIITFHDDWKECKRGRTISLVFVGSTLH